jgi:hypothetical protein
VAFQDTFKPGLGSGSGLALFALEAGSGRQSTYVVQDAAGGRPQGQDVQAVKRVGDEFPPEALFITRPEVHEASDRGEGWRALVAAGVLPKGVAEYTSYDVPGELGVALLGYGLPYVSRSVLVVPVAPQVSGGSPGDPVPPL